MASGAQCCVHNSFMCFYEESDCACDAQHVRRARSVDNYELLLKRKTLLAERESDKREVSNKSQPTDHLAHQNSQTRHAGGHVAAPYEDHASGAGATEHDECTPIEGISGGGVPSNVSQGHPVGQPNSVFKKRSRKNRKGKVKNMTMAPALSLGSMTQLLSEDESSPALQIVMREVDSEIHAQTTLMLRNIACRYSQSDVVRIFGGAGMTGKFDFLHLPLNFSRTANLGYLFVNFTKPEYAESCWATFDGHVFGPSRTSKICEVRVSTTQGLVAIVAHFATRQLPRGRNAHILMSTHWEAEVDGGSVNE